MERGGRRAGGAAGFALALFLLAGLIPGRSHAAELFQLDQRYGSIAFSVSNLGLFRSHGGFARFDGRLTIDLSDPTATDIAVTVVTDSLHTPWPDETQMLRSTDFFDVARYPVIRFASSKVEAAGPGRYRVHGRIEIRGISRPITLDARLTHESRDPASGKRIDDFAVTGELSRRAFGMTAEPLFVGDRVAIDIHARIILNQAVDGG